MSNTRKPVYSLVDRDAVIALSLEGATPEEIATLIPIPLLAVADILRDLSDTLSGAADDAEACYEQWCRRPNWEAYAPPAPDTTGRRLFDMFVMEDADTGSLIVSVEIAAKFLPAMASFSRLLATSLAGHLAV